MANERIEKMAKMLRDCVEQICETPTVRALVTIKTGDEGVDGEPVVDLDGVMVYYLPESKNWYVDVIKHYPGSMYIPPEDTVINKYEGMNDYAAAEKAIRVWMEDRMDNAIECMLPSDI